MKVCTDACILGAYAAEIIRDKIKSTGRLLDIGTGTGLLSLLIAQKNDCSIDAVEIERDAYLQAKENMLNSPWKTRIQVIQGDIKTFRPEDKYDFIISNPPFFENELKAGEGKKDAARHDTTLTLEDLLKAIDRLLNADGFFTVLLPYHRIGYFEMMAGKYNFYLTDKLLIRQTPLHDFFRGVLTFERGGIAGITKELIIKKETGEYSDGFILLLKDYYLNL